MGDLLGDDAQAAQDQIVTGDLQVQLPWSQLGDLDDIPFVAADMADLQPGLQ